MNKKNQKSISGNPPNGGFIFISGDDKVFGLDNFFGSVLDRFSNLPLEEQKKIIDKMEKDDENLLNEL